MPFGFGFREPAKETLMRPFECTCVCHPVMQRPRAVKDHRCQECWEDGGKPWTEFLQSALDDVATMGKL